MRIVRYVTVIVVLLVMTAMAACSARVEQAEARLVISDTWVRPALASGTTAAYLNITNNSDNPITISGVTADFADMIQIHQTVVENDMAQMQHTDNGLRIGAGETMRLEPGGYHIMLMNVQQALNEGETVTLSITFDTGETITVETPIRNNLRDIE
jgi:periplasmic copper chaperone A